MIWLLLNLLGAAPGEIILGNVFVCVVRKLQLSHRLYDPVTQKVVGAEQQGLLQHTDSARVQKLLNKESSIILGVVLKKEHYLTVGETKKITKDGEQLFVKNG